MTQDEYNRCKTILILKYGCVASAINNWLETDEETDGIDMLEFYFAQPPKERQ
jgi:hypothetical protein